MEDDLAEHLRPQFSTRVGEGEPDLCRSRLRIEHRLDEGDPPSEHPVGNRSQRQRYRRAQVCPRQIALVRVGEYPDLRQIRDLEGRVPSSDSRPLHDVLRCHDTRDGRYEREVA